MHRRRCPEPMFEARKSSITSPSAIFSSLSSHYPSSDGRLSPWSTCALQPYTACKFTEPPWNGFLQPGILKHYHEHVPYFPAKNCSRSSSTWYGSLFLNRTYCVVPRQNWAKLRGLTLSSVTSYWCSVEGFYPTVFEHRPPLGKPLSRPSVSNHNFLSNSSWGARQSWWCPNSVTKLVNFLQYGFWENEFEVWIYHPLRRLWHTWPWVFNDVPTKFQCCSYLIGRAPRMNTLGSSGKHNDANSVTSKLTLLWLGSTSRRMTRTADGDYKDLFVFKLT